MKQLSLESLNNIINFCDKESVFKFGKVCRLWKFVFIKNKHILIKFIKETYFFKGYLNNDDALHRLIMLFDNKIEDLLIFIENKAC